VDIDFEIISGESLCEEIITGTVLDAAGTNYWKSIQLQKICTKFHNGTIEPNSKFLVCDIWFPGIEMIRYMSQLYNIPVSIWGIWHAGSNTMNDFAEPMHSWSKYFEVGFLNICNGIFVGTNYSRESIIERLLYFIPEENISQRIYSFGMPLNFNEIQKYKQSKEKIILFPHRPDEEKNPNIFIDIINALSSSWPEFNDYKFVFCTSKKEYKSKSKWINELIKSTMTQFNNIEIHENLNKEDYYTLLGKSSLVISTTSEENFGYCILEALALDCKILAPNCFSHPEIVHNDAELLYNNYDELLLKIPKILNTYFSPGRLQSYAEPYEEVIERWLNIMDLI
jgi:glycosyltransferase involved in cell wall biosynthesis